MSVRWGLTEETICGLMNAAPWPPSAGAFNASVGAGLLSSNTLAKADFFTGKLDLRSFGTRLCVCVYMCVLQGLGSQQAAAHFLLECSLHLNRCSRYIRSCAGARRHTGSTHTRAHTHSERAGRHAVSKHTNMCTHMHIHNFRPRCKSWRNETAKIPATCNSEFK